MDGLSKSGNGKSFESIRNPYLLIAETMLMEMISEASTVECSPSSSETTLP
jgi:phage terminase small subunit